LISLGEEADAEMCYIQNGMPVYSGHIWIYTNGHFRTEFTPDSQIQIICLL